MIRPCQYRRLAMCGLLLVAAFAGVGYRLVDLQVLRHEELKEAAARYWHKRVEHPTQRGRIYDARGQLLATSVPVKTVLANPERVGTNQALVARVLAPKLGMSEEDLAKRLQRRTVRRGDREVPVTGVVLKRRVAMEDWDRIREALADLPREVVESDGAHRLLRSSVYADPVDREARVYPNGMLAAHVLGFAGYRDERLPGVSEDELVGKSGIEAALNPVLMGVPGWRQVLRDVHQRELVAMRPMEVASRAGLSVKLTIDTGLQHIVESEIESAFAERAPISITALVVRPRTGEILAMANLPTFDPNRPGAVPPGYLRNRAITDLIEPGSTFKALVVAAALQEGVVSLGDMIFCENGQWVYQGRRMGDVGRHGLLSVEEIVAKSSNIGAAKVGIQLGHDRVYEYARAFGMGQPTRIALGGEVSGIMHPPRSELGISVAWVAMGYGVATTPLQMTMAMSALANGGVLMRPMLVSELLDAEGRTVARFDPTPVRQVVGERATRLITQALKRGVTDGTGRRAQMEHYEVAGKTGTAQKRVDGAYSRQKHVASFIGYFPADDPRLCIAVVIDEPRAGMYGGEVAAPVFRRIAERAAVYLAIPPTRVPEHTLETRGPASGLAGVGGHAGSR
jgi:cell division protein FtsI/penicillin-binding protein 2